MIAIRKAGDRGHANHGWLDTNHTFSFADYYDPQHMGFGPLRVINEDRVAPGRGFGTHGHRDMEIVSYVVSGALAHKDTIGAGGVIRRGEIQRMSAGTGVQHSEMNGSKTEPVHFLQIWIMPSTRGGAPAYEQKDFGDERGLVQLVGPDGRDGAIAIGQDVDIWRALLDADSPIELPLRHRRAWIQVVAGEIAIDGTTLGPGDGAALTDVSKLAFRTTKPTEALLFDLP
jgi:redox-sensitive bicupin YhaK (pirin superfamily)